MVREGTVCTSGPVRELHTQGFPWSSRTSCESGAPSFIPPPRGLCTELPLCVSTVLGTAS